MGTSFWLNPALVSALRAQGSASVQEAGHGEMGYGGDVVFSAGAAKGFNLSLVSDGGGLKLKYRPYASGASEFYFNPGECR